MKWLPPLLKKLVNFLEENGLQIPSFRSAPYNLGRYSLRYSLRYSCVTRALLVALLVIYIGQNIAATPAERRFQSKSGGWAGHAWRFGVPSGVVPPRGTRLPY